MKRSVSVVIPNYNGKNLLEKNLPSVFRALQKANLDYEVIIPDDNSQDDSVVFLRKHYLEVKVLSEKVNLGFSGNINRGLRTAKNDLVLALNSDIYLHEDYFLAQLPYFDKENVFGVMGAICEPVSDKPIRLNLGLRQDFFGLVSATNLEGYNFDKPLPMYFPSGSNLLMDRNKLVQLNYFNELFSPFYGEDIDLDLRAWRSGWVSFYEPRSICYHESSATIQKYNRKKKIRIVSRRNKFILHTFHLEGFDYFKFHLKLIIDTLTRFLVLDFSYYQSLWQFLQRRPTLMQQKEKFKEKLSLKNALKKAKGMIQDVVSPK